jgi:hypothetical protein
MSLDNPGIPDRLVTTLMFSTPVEIDIRRN